MIGRFLLGIKYGPYLGHFHTYHTCKNHFAVHKYIFAQKGFQFNVDKEASHVGTMMKDSDKFLLYGLFEKQF